MRTIVVATDFSSSGNNAAAYAASLAMALRAKLFLFHAFEVPGTYEEISVPVNLAKWRRNSEASLHALQQDLELKTNNLITIRAEVHWGSFFHELELVCDALNPYAVVIGSTGKTVAERLLFGTSAAYTLRHLPWPVIAVPPGGTFSRIKKVGLACDLKDVRETIPFEEIEILIRDLEAELHLLNIGGRTVYDPEVKFASHLLNAKQESAKLQFHFLRNPDVDQGILDFAERETIDLLIVLPKRQSFINALLHKSHTRQFVLHSHVPVMALHAAKTS